MTARGGGKLYQLHCPAGWSRGRAPTPRLARFLMSRPTAKNQKPPSPSGILSRNDVLSSKSSWAPAALRFFTVHLTKPTLRPLPPRLIFGTPATAKLAYYSLHNHPLALIPAVEETCSAAAPSTPLLSNFASRSFPQSASTPRLKLWPLPTFTMPPRNGKRTHHRMICFP